MRDESLRSRMVLQLDRQTDIWIKQLTNPKTDRFGKAILKIDGAIARGMTDPESVISALGIDKEGPLATLYWYPLVCIVLQSREFNVTYYDKYHERLFTECERVNGRYYDD